MARIPAGVFLAVCWLCGAQTTDQPASVAGTILDAATDAPLRGATVSLNATRRGEPRRRTTTTDAGGRFHFEDVEPGPHYLSAEKKLYVGRAHGQTEGEFSRPSVIDIGSGERVRDLVLKLIPTAVVSGRVVDGDGEPVLGISVSALRYRYQQGRRELEGGRQVSTDDRGDYRLWGLRPGQVYIAASGNHEPRMEFPPRDEATDDFVAPRVFYPGVLEPAEATTLQIRGGEECAGIDIRLQRVRTYRLSGRVEGGSGSISVSLNKAEDLYSRSSHGLRKGKREFTFVRILPGNYVLSAEVRRTEDDTLYARQRVEVTGSDIPEITLRLRPPMRLSGRVETLGESRVDFSRLRILLR
ncbi:MAG: hypothetical protein GY953_11960, partial [bacterium]|nr:hypothetical protein [bacterium]